MTRRKVSRPAAGDQTPKPDEGKLNFSQFLNLTPGDQDKTVDLWSKLGGPRGEAAVKKFEDFLLDRRIKPSVRSTFLTWRSKKNAKGRRDCEYYEANIASFQAAKIYIEMDPADRDAAISRPPERQVVKGSADFIDGFVKEHRRFNDELEKKLRRLKRRMRRR